ncbi:MAG: hypothetical protein B7Z80_01900 [Rhodospirillales bacterium 20-64-7]|nr:MAG: hypothetical protein B7Z80_01900 [Rhodospirillales bacterium 20-64-7]HQT75774.1 NrsF family protein [Rhodopila sp.]
METERLIEQLVGGLTPVHRIARPVTRLAWWLLISLPAAGLVVWFFGPRPDLAARLADRSFLIEEGAALLTAFVGIYAALCAGLPDQPDWKVWLPMAPMALWFGVLGQQCLDVFLRLGPGGLQVTSDAMCLPAIALGGLVPAIAITVMLRRSGKVRTTHACLCGALGAAALGAAALRLYHTEDAAIMVIVWQLGSVVLFSLLAGAIARLFADTRPDSISRTRL